MSVAITWRKRRGRAVLVALAFIVLSVVFGVTDFLRAKRVAKPLFSVAWTHYSDGGTAEYTGLLYLNPA